jgi:adsorption protein B
MDGGVLIDAGALLVREISLFAAAGFLLLGAGDLAIDIIWLGLKLRRRLRRNIPSACAATLAAPAHPGRIAIFVPAWDEAAVIGPMLRHALAAWGTSDFRIFIGCYPNDPETAQVVRSIADPRLRLVVGDCAGPTTKADCLNLLWRALLEEERVAGPRFKAVVLHDAEDVVHSAELRIFDTLIERFDLLQLPVLPLIDRSSRWIAGHYADEFAESHGKEMVVREALGAGLPSAGVGCAISRSALGALAERDGTPFDPASLTEDYELGLKLKALGRSGAFVRLPAGPNGAAIATRGHFPSRWRDAITQKSRWITGIALSGWDRLGWHGGFAERWMRMRDRQVLLAALLMCAAYAALLMAAPLATLAQLVGHPVQLVTPTLAFMMDVAAALLVWRLAMRFAFVTRCYGWREGMRAIPRVVVSNAIAIIAAREAVGRYLRIRRTGEALWGKTSHIFPSRIPAE